MKQQQITDVLTFLRRSKALETTKRYRSSLRDKQNSVADHSWRVAVMTLVIGTECKADLDLARAVQIALLHDVAEATTGDIDAYEQIIGGEQVIEKKSVAEEAAVNEMTGDLQFGSFIYDIWREYEDQRTLESKFVKALDRIEGFLHIAEIGVEAYIPEEFHADYATSAVAAFDEATAHFPGLKDLLDTVKTDLRAQFEQAGVKWYDSEKAAVTA